MEENDVEKGPSEFAFAITRIAVAQICRSVGFRTAQQSALEILTDIAARYLRALAESASSSANSSGRTQSNLYDIIRALEDLGSVQGFPSASDANRTLLTSSTLSELQKFVKYTDEIPFAKPIPRRVPPPKQPVPLPVDSRNQASSMSFVHIPRWLPAIPDVGAADIDKKGRTQEDEIGVDIDVGIGSYGGVDGGCLVSEKKASQLPAKRPMVRFRLGRGGAGSEMGSGVDLRSGVCRGGKRVSVQNRTDEGGGGGDDNKKKSKCSSSSSRSKTKRRGEK